MKTNADVFQLTFKNSGKHCAITAHQTLLEAATQGGIRVPYSCKSGVCANCKGHLLAGKVNYPTYPPVALTEQEQANGDILLCCAHPLSDLLVQAKELPHDMPLPRFMAVRVEQKQLLAKDVMKLTLKLPSSEKLQFKAGQYLEFILANGQRRAFSMASPPHRDGMIELHIRHVAGGAFTEYVFKELAEKTILRVEVPLGDFYIRESKTPLLMMATGTGFAPIKAMLEDLAYRGIAREIYFYWGGTVLEDLYERDWVERWAEHHAHFHFTPVLSRPVTSWQGHKGYVQQAVLADFSHIADYEVYCCGVPQMINEARRDLYAHGLASDSFFTDSFVYAPHAENTM